MFCMTALTSQSKKLVKYYITMEEVINEYIDLQIEEQRKINKNNKKIIEDNKKQLEDKDKELSKLKIKYKESIKTGSIYLFSTDKPDIIKCGRTKCVDNRKNALQTGSVDKIELLDVYKTSNDILLESVIHDIFKNYRVSGREHFNCNIEYMKSILQITGNIFDILRSCYEYISKKEIIEKIKDKLDTI